MSRQIDPLEAKVIEIVDLLNKFIKDLNDRPSSDNTQVVRYIESFSSRKFRFKILTRPVHNGFDHIYAFIDKSGNILMPNNYYTPHPKPRGNLFAEDKGYSAFYEYGVKYANHFDNCGISLEYWMQQKGQNV